MTQKRQDEPLVLTYSVGDRLAIWAGLPVAGLVLGCVLPPAARWILELPGPKPVRPAFRLVAAADGPWELAICLCLGLVVGLVASFAVTQRSARITLTAVELGLHREGRSTIITRPDVASVFLDGDRLVVLDRESRQLVRERFQTSPGALSAALRGLEYPWRNADPYAGLYRLWTPPAVGLPPAVNAVLAAREVALTKKSDRDQRELRDVLQQSGFTVRDDGVRQYWRPLVRS